MKMISDPINVIAALVGEYFDGVLKLSKEEIKILQQALAICEKADNLLRGGDTDNYNLFTDAFHGLRESLETYGKED
jgi:hypothetical protein